MSRRKGIIVVLLLFIGSVLLRLPNINRPLSRHHEFNTAVILVNIESWRQSGGGSRYHYIPLLNYQHPGDKCPPISAQVDPSGNVLYVSFGPGWYVIPYFIYQVFDLPAEAKYLQVINLFFHLAAVVMLFLLCEVLFPQDKRYESVVLTCCLFIFSPGVLWYLGNGYVLTGIEMPFVLAALLVLIPMLRSPAEINPRRLGKLGVLIIVLVYIDWFVLFLSFVTFIRLVFSVRKDGRYIPLLFVIGAASLAGVALLLLQFASYVGFEKLFLSLKYHFFVRSITGARSSFFSQLTMVMQHIASSYLPVVFLLAGVLGIMLRRKLKGGLTEREVIFLAIYASAVVLYNLFLLQWSAVHEFALIPLSVLLVVITARLTMRVVNNTGGFYAVMSSYIFIACVQYYLINRPGEVSVAGTRYDCYERFGRQLQNIPLDHKLFMDTTWNAAIDHYAHRNFTVVRNIDSARAFVQRWGVSKAVWIGQRDYKLEKIVALP
jgi:hypothetical protein